MQKNTMKLDLLNDALKDVEKRFKDNVEILDKAAYAVELIDLRIHRKEKEIESLEAIKQEELNKMRDVMEVAGVNSYTRKNGYKIYYRGNEQMEITNIRDFMQWLKKYYSPDDVLSFFAEAIKLGVLQKFIQDHIARDKDKGIITSEVDGIDIQKSEYRRLRTNADKRKK